MIPPKTILTAADKTWLMDRFLTLAQLCGFTDLTPSTVVAKNPPAGYKPARYVSTQTLPKKQGDGGHSRQQKPTWYISGAMA
jgi:hypothetical protein